MSDVCIPNDKEYFSVNELLLKIHSLKMCVFKQINNREDSVEQIRKIINELSQKPKGPTVTEYRSILAKLFFNCYPTEKTVSRSKNYWQKPIDWPEKVPFGDPNNNKTKKSTIRLLKPDLKLMYEHLSTKFKVKRKHFRHI